MGAYIGLYLEVWPMSTDMMLAFKICSFPNYSLTLKIRLHLVFVCLFLLA